MSTLPLPPTRRRLPPLLKRAPPAGPIGLEDRLVVPETRWEMIEGRMIYASPAREAHATLHMDLCGVLRFHLVAGFRGAADLLTRVSADSDIAPDVSIYPADPDPVTGGRQLEQLAFEIVDRQAMAVPTKKARLLAARGVRRIFCVKLRRAGRQLLEWDAAADRWVALAEGALIHDPVLARPVSVSALLRAAEGDDAVAAALLARENPVLEQALNEGAVAAERALIHRMLLQRFPAQRAQIDALVARLDRAQAEKAADLLLTSPDLDALIAGLPASPGPG